METIKRDPLLLAAQGLLWLCIGVLGVALVAIGIAIPVAAIFRNDVIAQAAANGIAAGPELVWAIVSLLAAVAVFLGLALYFMVLLRRIVDSVRHGDPFVADNADRLSRMGWTALAAQLATIPLGALSLWVAEIAKDAENIRIDTGMGLDLGGVLLVLILFILARVFRKGAQMREELEGTV